LQLPVALTPPPPPPPPLAARPEPEEEERKKEAPPESLSGHHKGSAGSDALRMHGRPTTRMAGRLPTLVTLLLLLLLGLTRLPPFYAAYMHHVLALEDDAWLRAQCADPLFVSRMMRHHDVCERVRASFRQPALLVALQACFPSEWQALLPSIGWEWGVLAALVIFLAPGLLLLPLYRVHRERATHLRLLAAASPELPLAWRYGGPLGCGGGVRRAPQRSLAAAHDDDEFAAGAFD
jgi:hypothetical protein